MDQEQHRSGFGPELAALAVVAVWGSTFTITKTLYDEMLPLAFGSSRFLVIVAIAFAVLWFRAHRAHRPDWLHIRREDIPLFIVTGLCGYTLYQLGFLLGLEHTSPFAGSLMISLQPLVTLLIVTVIGERQPAVVWMGAIVAVIGVTIFLLSGDKDSKLLGNLIAFGGGCAFALYQVFGRRLVRTYHPATYSFYSTLCGAIPLMLIGIPEVIRQDWSSISQSSWISFLYMCILPVYLAYILWSWAIRHRGVAISGFTLLVPVIAGIMSWLAYGETFNTQKLIGGAVAIIGLVVMQRANRVSTAH